MRMTGKSLREQRLVFFGAGSAAIGVADAVVRLFMEDGRLSLEEARQHVWLIDSKVRASSTSCSTRGLIRHAGSHYDEAWRCTLCA